MSDKDISYRQRLILLYSRIGRSYSLSDITEELSAKLEPPSAPTLRRDMAELCDLGFFLQIGSKKATKYQLNHNKLFSIPIDAHEYCRLDIDTRPGNAQFNFDLLSSVPDQIFDTSELAILEKATQKYLQASQGASPAIRKKELERFVIELSWKSSKLEGNTYTLLDTELLIKEGIEAPGHSREEAIMILNHKKALDFIVTSSADYLQPRLAHIIDIHRLLVTDLNIPFGLRQGRIGITGSLYRPLQVPTQIEEACNELLELLRRLSDPFSKALMAIAGIGYLQPFEDGNKRTSRLTANALLLANQCAPLSYRSISELEYREAMLTFYEKNTILPLKKLFFQQYLFACENYLQFR